MDGSVRNLVGQEGEQAIKERLQDWLAEVENLEIEIEGPTTWLGEDHNLKMVYGSEPDIMFQKLQENGEWEIVSTIEIKSGTDPAGALERLGAIQKSFNETPAQAKNFAVLGVVTPTMRIRLNDMQISRDFMLYRLLNDPDYWEEFAREIFHYTLRIVE